MGCRNIQEQVEIFSHSRSEQFLKQNTIAYSTFQRPWTVVLLKYEGRIASVRCGATIISPKMVITAASCFFDEKTKKPLDMNDYSVVLGTNDPMNVTEGFERRLSRVMIHPKYKYPQVCTKTKLSYPSMCPKQFCTGLNCFEFFQFVLNRLKTFWKCDLWTWPN